MPSKILTVKGHCYSKKNHRPIFRAGRRGRPFLGKTNTLKQYENVALLQIKAQWGSWPALSSWVEVVLVIRFAGPTPDAFGPSETIFDCLQAAGVVKNDSLLCPQAVIRERVKKGQEEVEIRLDW